MVQILNYNAKKFKEIEINEIHKMVKSYENAIGIDYNWYKLVSFEMLKWYKEFKSMGENESAKRNMKWFMDWTTKATQERMRINAKEEED